MPPPRSCLYCPTILSQYNGDTLCGPCQQEERGLSSKERRKQRTKVKREAISAGLLPNEGDLWVSPIPFAMLSRYQKTRADPGKLPDPYRLSKEDREAYYTGEWMGEDAVEMMRGEG